MVLAWWWLNEPKHVTEFLIFNFGYQYMLCQWRNKFNIIAKHNGMAPIKPPNFISSRPHLALGDTAEFLYTWKGTFEIHRGRGISRFPERLPAYQEAFFCMEIDIVLVEWEAYVMCALYALHVKNIQPIYCYTSDTVGLQAYGSWLIICIQVTKWKQDRISLHMTPYPHNIRTPRRDGNHLSYLQHIACTSVRVLTWDLRSSGILRSI